MMVSLHKNARTTPLIRAEIATSTDSARVLAERYGISEGTVYKWKHRKNTTDRSHTAHRLQTRLTPEQEAIAVYLRQALLLPLDDLLAVTREFLCPDISRSGLDRCLRRHGVGNLNALKPKTPQEAPKSFKAYEPGYLAHRYQISATDGGRNPSTLSVRRHRPGHTLGIRRPQAQQDRSQRQKLSCGPAYGLSHQNQPHPHRQRQGVHGSTVRQPGTTPHRTA